MHNKKLPIAIAAISLLIISIVVVVPDHALAQQTQPKLIFEYTIEDIGNVWRVHLRYGNVESYFEQTEDYPKSQYSLSDVKEIMKQRKLNYLGEAVLIISGKTAKNKLVQIVNRPDFAYSLVIYILLIFWAALLRTFRIDSSLISVAGASAIMIASMVWFDISTFIVISIICLMVLPLLLEKKATIMPIMVEARERMPTFKRGER